MKINLLPYVNKSKWQLFLRAAKVLRETTKKQIYGFMYGPNPDEACALGACYSGDINIFDLQGCHFIVNKKMTSVVDLNDDYKLTFKQIADVLEAAADGKEEYEIVELI